MFELQQMLECHANELYNSIQMRMNTAINQNGNMNRNTTITNIPTESIMTARVLLQSEFMETEDIGLYSNLNKFFGGAF